MVTTTSKTVPGTGGFKRSVGGLPILPDKEQLQELAKRDFRAATDFQAAIEYATDFWQRSVLFLDILRQSGNQQAEMTSRPINAVLVYDHELILRGTNLPRPVNYGLVRVVPPRGTVIDYTKRPVVIIDPRAGQGPGVGGFKPVSEIGQAFKAGHPVYFVGFAADPVEGQTVEDVAHAFTVFLDKVIELEPKAIGKPFVFGNCQAGWHGIMAACMRPDLFGPIVVAGAPLSYWAGVRGKNPMRYDGGLLGGAWIERLMGDLGGGFIDGAWFVINFDSLNPANTLWTKRYDVWAAPEKEKDRYLQFDRWWGAFVRMRAEELDYIVDNLFIGNKLSTAQIVTRDGIRIDMRNIKSPILCFCSKGDNITPPQQALGWILDNYDSVDDIRKHGQTILYCLHETAGHLAIFVGTKVAAKEHSEFINYMDLIDGLPPGLYEIVITDKSKGEAGAELLEGDYNVRIEERGLEDIVALGGNSIEDEREFEAVAHLSEISKGLYATFPQPWIKPWITSQVVAAMQRMQTLRLSYALFSDKNPLMRGVAPLAEKARAERKPVDPDNPFLKIQGQVSDMMTASLQALGSLCGKAAEATFHAVYGSPWVQGWLGVMPHNGRPRPKPGTSPDQEAALVAKAKELRTTMAEGGPLEAMVRAGLYVVGGQHAIDARTFEVLRRILKEHPDTTLDHFKAVVREQWARLVIDEKAALQALPRLLPADAAARRALCDEIRAIGTATGELEGEARRRLDEIQVLFESQASAPAPELTQGGTS
jgi:pimeloyl-ACP methyl ester carboxylesterase